MTGFGYSFNRNTFFDKHEPLTLPVLIFFSFLAWTAFAQPAFAATWQVGPGKTYATPAALSQAKVVQSGDTVLIDGNRTYNDAEAVVLWKQNSLTIRGVLINGKRPVMDTTGYYTWLPEVGSDLDEIWEIRGDNVLVENIEFTGANQGKPGSDTGGVGAGIGVRCPDATVNTCTNRVTIKNCYFHHNEVGLQSFSSAPIDLTIEGCEFAFSGDLDSNWKIISDQYSHNVYIGNIKKFTMKNSYSYGAYFGHEVKTRARENHILFNRIATGSPVPFDTGSCNIDIPNAGLTYVIGNELYKGPHSDNYSSIQYGCESGSNQTKELYVSHNTFVGDYSGARGIRLCDSATAQGTKIKIVNNIFDKFGGIIRSESSDANFYTPLNNFTADNITAGALFVNRTEKDWHLLSGSAGINTGANPGTANGISLLPLHEYLYKNQLVSRVSDGHPDMGAHEYGSGATGTGLQDAIVTLKVLSGVDTGSLPENLDRNSDGLVGLSDAIFILQEVSELR